MDTPIDTVRTREGLLGSPTPIFTYAVLALWPVSVTFQPCDISLACFSNLTESRLENPSRTVVLDTASETANSIAVQYCRSPDSSVSSGEWLLKSGGQ